MFRVYHHRSFQLLNPPHFSTENQDMCRGTIGAGPIEMKSQHDQKSGTL